MVQIQNINKFSFVSGSTVHRNIDGSVPVRSSYNNIIMFENLSFNFSRLLFRMSKCRVIIIPLGDLIISIAISVNVREIVKRNIAGRIVN